MVQLDSETNTVEYFTDIQLLLCWYYD